MLIKVSEHVDYEIPPESLEFVQEVSVKEDLGDWTLDIWSCRGEGVCEVNIKKIRFGFCRNLFSTKWLFLHEIAHAKHPGDYKSKDWWKSYWHERSWQELFVSLLMDYLPDWFWAYKHRDDPAGEENTDG